MNEDDIKLLNLVLDRLIDYAKDDMSSFRARKQDYMDSIQSEVCDEYDDPIWISRKNKGFNIDWNPKNNSWKPDEYTYKGRVDLRYNLMDKTVSIYADGYSRRVEIGGGSENKDIKIKMMKLFKEVKEWEKIEVPRKEREDFINGLTNIFPDILDHMILEGNYDEEDEES